MTRLERSIIDASAWTKHLRSACGLIVAAVQQRLTKPGQLLAELENVGQVRHRAPLRAVLIDVEGGGAIVLSGQSLLRFPTVAL
jgi:hypothetical protein